MISTFQSFALASALAAMAIVSEADPRLSYSEDAPRWLRAVGKLSVPGYRMKSGDKFHQLENCTATLIGRRTILTAWHCLEFYRDLSRDISFSLPQLNNGRPQIAIPVTHGGGMGADWALLRLRKPVPAELATPVPLQRFSFSNVGEIISMAGYSGDEGMGRGGDTLTYHPSCTVVEQEMNRVNTDCLAYKGASGGPVISNGKIIGVVSAGDSAANTWFVASASFIVSARAYIGP